MTFLKAEDKRGGSCKVWPHSKVLNNRRNNFETYLGMVESYCSIAKDVLHHQKHLVDRDLGV